MNRFLSDSGVAFLFSQGNSCVLVIFTSYFYDILLLLLLLCYLFQCLPNSWKSSCLSPVGNA